MCVANHPCWTAQLCFMVWRRPLPDLPGSFLLRGCSPLPIPAPSCGDECEQQHGNDGGKLKPGAETWLPSPLVKDVKRHSERCG